MPYVLVVDDDPTVRMMITEFLAVMELESKQAVNGEQALEMVGDELPALILLDLMMPVMNGFTTLSKLHEDPRSRGVPVILLSAVAENDHHMLRLPGVVGILQKGNFSVKDLKSMISEAMQS